MRAPLALLLTLSLLFGCSSPPNDGDGGGTPPAQDSDPVPVASTSYENFKGIGLTPIDLPVAIRGVGSVRTYFDFNQDGAIDIFSATLTYDHTLDPSQATPSTFRFWTTSTNGEHVENTSLLSDADGCVHPRKAIVADFNGDDLPDVFVACHGYDASPFPGEQNRVLLSQPNGAYSNQPASNDVGFFHSASAADFNGDTFVDVLVVNNSDTSSAFVLLNDGQGSFERSVATFAPSAIANLPYYTAEVVDIDSDSHLDLVFGGHEFEGATTRVFLNPGLGDMDFRDVSGTPLPSVANEGVVLDFAVVATDAGPVLWVLRTSGGDGTFYMSRVLQEITWPGLVSSIPVNERPGNWVQWIVPMRVADSNIIASPDASTMFSHTY